MKSTILLGVISLIRVPKHLFSLCFMVEITSWILLARYYTIQLNSMCLCFVRKAQDQMKHLQPVGPSIDDHTTGRREHWPGLPSSAFRAAHHASYVKGLGTL